MVLRYSAVLIYIDRRDQVPGSVATWRQGPGPPEAQQSTQIHLPLQHIATLDWGEEKTSDYEACFLGQTYVHPCTHTQIQWAGLGDATGKR